MIRTWTRNFVNRQPRPSLRGRRRPPRARLHLEPLEDRCVPAGTLTGVPFTSLFPQPVEGSAFTGQVATVFDTGASPTFTVSIDWGDGTAPSAGTVAPIPNSPDAFAVNGTHTYAEESSSVTPPFNFAVTVTIRDTANNLGPFVINSQGSVLDANLSQGNPTTETPSQTFFGGGAGQPSAGAELTAFEAAIGGVKNTQPAPQNGGFRTITWDGVKTDGSDSVAGPNSTVVVAPNVVGIPLDRFENTGVFFGAVYAVSGSDANGNTFTTANPGVAGLFPPFSHPNTFAMFNDNGIDFKFVVPSPDNTTIVTASSRGFGAIFINVELPNTTTIQYFNGNNLLATESAPVGGKGQPVFVGALFPDAVVTRVVLTLGTDVIFRFDGTTLGPGTAADNPAGGTNLVVTDDWAFPEPVPTPNGLPIVTGAQGSNHAAQLASTASVGVSFSGVVASFNDQDPNGNAKDFTATINWGDGHLTNATITANGHGGFDVSGTNTYASAGLFPINVDIADFGGGNGISGSAPTVSVNNTLKVLPGASTVSLQASTGSATFGSPVTLIATVSPVGPGVTPTGTVTFFNNGKELGTVTLNGAGQAFLTTTDLNPGNQAVFAGYSGDANFGGSTSGAVGINISPDVTNLVSVGVVQIRRRSRRRFDEIVIVRNVSGSLIPAPVFLALDNLPAGGQLLNMVGVTHFLAPLGSPLAAVNLSGASELAPGAGATVTLQFVSRSAALIHFRPRVLAGTVLV